jgi:hypothetical protein
MVNLTRSFGSPAGLAARSAPVLGRGSGLAFRQISFLLLAAAVVTVFSVSGSLLIKFSYPYITPGGSPLFKFHPSTYLVLLSLFAAMMHQASLTKIQHLAQGEPVFLMSIAAQVCIMVYSVTVLNASFSAPVDTWIAPVLFVFMLLLQSTENLGRIRTVLHVVLLVNSVVGVGEYLTGYRLVEMALPDAATGAIIDTRAWTEWRATGLLGHPLSATLVTGFVAVAMGAQLAFRGFSPLRLFALGHSLIALPAFGGRTSIVAALFVLGLIFMARGVAFVRGRKIRTPDLLVVAIGFGVAATAFAAAVQLGFLDPIIERFRSDDGSARTRIYALRLFASTPLNELLFGDLSQSLFLRAKKIGTGTGIEISPLGYILQYGFIWFFITYTLLAGVIVSIAKRFDGLVWWAILYFGIATLSGTGLASKTQELAFGLCMACLLFERRSEPGDKPSPDSLDVLQDPPQPAPQ